MTQLPNWMPAIERIALAESDLSEAQTDLHTYDSETDSAGRDRALHLALSDLERAGNGIRAAIALIVLASRDSDTPASWETIGNALGMSRQAAWERYSGVQVRPAE